MKCCINCFNDSEIISVIRGIHKKGNCDFCKTNNTYVYDIEKNNTITEYFDDLLSVYTPESFLPSSFPKEKLDLIKNILYSKWNIFNLDSDHIYRLLKSLCKERYHNQPELFDKSVGISEIINDNYISNSSILGKFNWQEFSNEIKSKNRFHTHHINKDVLKYFLEYSIKEYNQGYKFYRARICLDKNGFCKTSMGAPPANLAKAGRVNSEGISCLYLADSIKTSVHETRAGMYDYVSIGEFKLIEDIKIINLAEIDKISPFNGIDCMKYAVNIDNLKTISNEIAKPLRRNDSFLDYLPTQYICDYIKSQNYMGIEYKSTMLNNGTNFAIFNEKLLKCTKVSVYDIKTLSYDFIEI